MFCRDLALVVTYKHVVGVLRIYSNYVPLKFLLCNKLRRRKKAFLGSALRGTSLEAGFLAVFSIVYPWLCTALICIGTYQKQNRS